MYLNFVLFFFLFFFFFFFFFLLCVSKLLSPFSHMVFLFCLCFFFFFFLFCRKQVYRSYMIFFDYFLMLVIFYRWIVICFFFFFFFFCGNGDRKERIALIQRFIAIFGKDRIVNVFADRELIGEQWFRWLIEQDINFGIRVKKT